MKQASIYEHGLNMVQVHVFCGVPVDFRSDFANHILDL